MCQAYEGERRSICGMEKIQRRRGYEARKRGESRSANPCFCWAPEGSPHNYGWNAWNLGWNIADKDGKLF